MAIGDDGEAAALIEALGLAPHPEGGWYRETWRAAAAAGARSAGTAILFLLEANQRSHWHRVDASEHWFWHAGAPLTLSIAVEGGPVETQLLGGDVLAGQQPQLLVPKDHWQAAVPQGAGRWSVAPSFPGSILPASPWHPLAGRRRARASRIVIHTYPQLCCRSRRETVRIRFVRLVDRDSIPLSDTVGTE